MIWFLPKFKDWWEVKNYKKCIEQLELMTKCGEADTSLLWGMCYRDGLGVKKDKAKAKQYFDSVSVGSTVYFGINSETHYLLKCQILEIKDGAGRRSKNLPDGEILLLPNGRRGAARLKHKESFALCGARLKALP